MAQNHSTNLEKIFIYAVLFIAVGAAGIIIIKNILPKKSTVREIAVKIEGNVKKPGTYYIPYGTSRFEVLRVSGISSNSDINNLDVLALAQDGENIQVGTLSKNVTVKSNAATPFVGNAAAINFFTGKLAVIRGGAAITAKPSMSLKPDDKLICDAGSMAEIKLGDGSIVDLRKNSELTIKALYSTNAVGELVLNFDLSKGSLWSFIKPLPENMRCFFSTPHMVAEIKGTEISISVDGTKSSVSVTKGFVFASKEGADQGINVTEGQTAVVYADPDKEVSVGPSADVEVFAADEKKFNDEKNKYLVTSEVKRILYLGLPDYYMVLEINPSQPVVNILRVDPTTSVADWVEGINELGKVYLYGGIGLVTSLVERIADRKIDHYMVHERNDVVEFIDNMGGVSVILDKSSAEHLKMSPGLQKLDGLNAILFMAPGKEGRGSSMERQNQVLQALMKSLSEKKTVFSVPLAGKLIAKVDTDIDVNYLLGWNQTFESRENWAINFSAIIK
ncbi:MAG: hypothetical protein A2268_09620 [Candidatus Raymondbacteria bacterium RifOxyA12_full_50_37]|uniref:FecR protein domain-containing protein n=1 Tax=Candidatus Raymondbacteria bacterium RIFOXYD12_FULL_49_13 TaxID=1817890 RepID=A0A1F7F1K5_UNCRA|nr:MAG: hypothetical protein A2268_09620 [Candidatus Raymondbacteria bacterium RifOxyA12_full_50_37]OGJ93146.1 MAG: hypothetical protein A2350_17815 [Candidatus Raymondbacteria bacterium RifOxyB12_full_50_8]OGJ93902.1 MAG: hypothetical protein A2248_06675 [Candidatus Raymondbacteria bacterium RIFOXYA2_FULL_49_16]OGJ98229.1 MAG: hypothetical protein A2453_00490 [Candidatus Raymondbacteria bacterium RIFOXYC2_FULL_50_21]OGK00462.1 MAG: hypothetical protein A2519_10665 [Candidatus Raymondbacteria b